MPSTHFCLHFHLIFSTKERKTFIDDSWRDRLYSYIGGVIRSLGGVLEEIGGTDNHVHILVSLNLKHSLPDLLREVKHTSSQWIHDKIGIADFSWQKGYGAFTVSPSLIEVVKSYIARQQEHHRKKGFEQEYLEFLQKSGAEYDERYLW
jgi:putative transposase